MKNSAEQAFVNAVLDNPGDDAPRLIFADWLDEQGDADRALFIRLQIQIAGLPEWNPVEVALRIHEEAALARHQKKWKAELPKIKGVKWGEFRRGFVSTATFDSFATLKSRAARCLSIAPIEAISIPWPRSEEGVENLSPISELRELWISDRLMSLDDAERMAGSPLLSTLKVLDVSERSLGIEGFGRLVASPHLRKLKTLAVPRNSIGNGASTALTTGGPLPDLTELDLSEIGSYGRYGEDPIIEASGVQFLANWPGLSRITSLKLSGNDVNRDGLRAILRSKNSANLKKLAIRGNGLTGPLMQEFEAAIPELQLDALDIGENLLRDVGPAYFAISRCLRGLKELIIDRCEVRAEGAKSLAKAPFMQTLRRLDTTDNSFGPDGLLALLAVRPPDLYQLNMGNNDLGDEGVHYLANFPDTNPLLQVNLAENGLMSDAARELGQTKYLRNLVALNVEANGMGKAAAEALARSPLGKRLLLLKREGA